MVRIVGSGMAGETILAGRNAMTAKRFGAILLFVLIIAAILMGGWWRYSNNQARKIRAQQLFSQQIEAPSASSGLTFYLTSHPFALTAA
jgi:high-affinity Fe2+/Pb2+ permease